MPGTQTATLATLGGRGSGASVLEHEIGPTRKRPNGGSLLRRSDRARATHPLSADPSLHILGVFGRAIRYIVTSFWVRGAGSCLSGGELNAFSNLAGCPRARRRGARRREVDR